MKNTAIKILSLTLILTTLVIGGCGGKKKKNARGAAEGVITGKIDYFSGLGMHAGRTPAGKTSAAKLSARLYRIQADGSGLAPVSEALSTPADGGSFKLEKATIGELNMIVRIENEKSETLFSAIVPPPDAKGTYVVVSPETSLEAALLQAIAKDGLKEKGDARPEEIDSAFIKDFVPTNMYFNGGFDTDGEKLSKVLLPIIKDAYLKFLEGYAGAGSQPGSEKPRAMTAAVTGPFMNMQIAAEKGDDISVGMKSDFMKALKKAADDNALTNEMMSPEATWLVARRMALLRAVKCAETWSMTPTCPERPEGADMSVYASMLKNHFESQWDAENLSARIDALFGGADTASGTRRMPPVDVVWKMANLPGAMVEPFKNDALALQKKLDTQGGRERAKALLSNLRDTLALTALGMDKQAVEQMMTSLDAAAQPLGATLFNPISPAMQVGNSHKQYLTSLDIPYGMLLAAAKAKYPKFEENDAKKLAWAMMRVAINSTLNDVPYYLYDSKDTDGDGFGDNAERILGTEASDGGSAIGDVLSATPGSLLPAPLMDSDSDGWFDAIEKVAGTNPDDRTSAPKPGKMDTCDAKNRWCAKAPADTDGGAYQIVGLITYNGAPMDAIKVGLYSQPEFIGKMPVYASEAGSDEQGGYSVRADRTGNFFVVAYRDSDASGFPSPGEAVGYYGVSYPQLYDINNANSGGKVNIEMIGIAGKPRCESGKYFHSPTEECMVECPAGMKKDELAIECRCSAGTVYGATTGKCEKTCPAGTTLNAAKGACVCPFGAEADKTAGKCVCRGQGMSFSAEKNACVCQSGYVLKKEMTCVDKCPSSFIESAATGACECPNGMKVDESGLKCVCDSGYKHPSGLECVESCDPLFVTSKNNELCECPENMTYDKEKRICVCVPGMEKNAQGLCATPGQVGKAMGAPGSSTATIKTPAGAGAVINSLDQRMEAPASSGDSADPTDGN